MALNKKLNETRLRTLISKCIVIQGHLQDIYRETEILGALTASNQVAKVGQCLLDEFEDQYGTAAGTEDEEAEDARD